MMNDDWQRDPGEFWRLVDLGRRDYAAFVAALDAADRRGLIRFAWWFEHYQSTLRQPPYQDTADPDFSEDELDDLADEVVGKGRAFYEAVLADPALMPEEEDRRDAAHKMRYQAARIFRARYGEELPPCGHDY
jgi:Protein of unknown function (DUF4240)